MNTPGAERSGARRAGLALLSGVALAGCLGSTDDLFPAISVAPSSEVPSAIEQPPSAPALDEDITPVPERPAGAELPAPPVALDTGTPETSGEGIVSPGPPPTDGGEPTEEAAPPDPAPPAESEAPADDQSAASDDAQLCATITDPLLLDFASPGDDPTQALFGDFQRLFSGGTYVYPTLSAEGTAPSDDAPGLFSDVTAGDWHVMGSVAQQAGFGLFFDCQLLDASRFAGLAFRVSGQVEGDTITLLVGTADNDVSRAWRLASDPTSPPSSGRCTPESNEYDGTCTQARIEIAVSPQAREIVVPFSALGGGSPEPGVNPAEITTIAWALPSPATNRSGDVRPYAVDLRIDDIRFVEPAL